MPRKRKTDKPAPGKPELPAAVLFVIAGLKMGTRMLWPFASRAMKSQQALVQSAQARGHDPALIDEAIGLYHQLCKAHPRWTKYRIENRVKDATSIPPRTLRRYLAAR